MSEEDKKNLRHEIANQLTVISLCAERAARESSAEERAKHLQTIQDRAHLLVAGVRANLK